MENEIYYNNEEEYDYDDLFYMNHFGTNVKRVDCNVFANLEY